MTGVFLIVSGQFLFLAEEYIICSIFGLHMKK